MKTSTQDKMEGFGKQMAGSAKRDLGEATGDREMKKEGSRQETSGKVQKKVGDIKQVFDK